MNRLLILLALAGMGAAACGDDSDDDAPDSDAGAATATDAAAAARADAAAREDAATAIRPQQIDSAKVGVACTAASAKSDCTGVGATCLTTSMLGDYPGGYCSASCQASAECGENGGCPVGDLLASVGSLLGGASSLITSFLPADASSCLKKCSAPSDCRTGYTCSNITSLFTGLGGAAGGGAGGAIPGGFNIGSLLGSSGTATFCMPPVMLPDAGLPAGFPVRDGGTSTTTTITGMDAGR